MRPPLRTTRPPRPWPRLSANTALTSW